MFLLLSFFVFSNSHGCFAEQKDFSLPATLSPVIINNITKGMCPSVQVLDEVKGLLQNRVIPALKLRSSCPCGGRGDWTRIVFLNMSDPSVQCPPNWRLSTNLPIRGCGRSTDTGPSCDSAIFPSNGRNYSRVCGRIVGYQQRTPDAFFNINRVPGATLEDSYLDGVSVTHGLAGSRQHIWSFASGVNKVQDIIFNCPCVVPNMVDSQVIPTFIEGSYFCESGNPLPTISGNFFPDDPLWDGRGCSSSSTCCQLNNPPYFCTTLPQVTTDAIELRICLDESTENEDVIVNLVDIYVM